MRKAAVCAGVEASGRRLEAVSHRAASRRLAGVWPAGRAPPYEAADWPEIITWFRAAGGARRCDVNTTH